jgi:hypothetical protein
MWVASWNNVDEIERLSHFQQKAMLIIVFNGTAEDKAAMVSASQRINRTPFMEYVLGLLTGLLSSGQKIS